MAGCLGTATLATGTAGRLLDGDASVLTVPSAAGDDVWILGEGHMDDAPIRRRHGIQRDGPPPPSHMIRGAQGDLLQSVDVALLVALHVDTERDIVAG